VNLNSDIYLLLKKQVNLLLLAMLIISFSGDIFSQKLQGKPTRQSSLEAFSKGDWEQAYKEFNELLVTYPKDPLYKYYSGVCLINLNRDPGEAVSRLKQALETAAIRALPSDAQFYLGRAQQMNGKYSEAVESYNSFIDQAGKKMAREYRVSEFIQQCKDEKGEVEEVEAGSSKIAGDDTTKSIQQFLEPVVEKGIISPAQNQKEILLKPDYDYILDKAISFQFKADSLNSVIEKQYVELEKIPYVEKSTLKTKISENELLAESYQKSADMKYDEAQEVLNPRPEKIQQKKEEVISADSIEAIDTIRKAVSIVGRDSVQKTNSKKDKEAVIQTDTIKKIEPIANKLSGVFSYFEILPKPVTDKNERITIDPEVPKGLIYRIQVAVFRNPVAPAYFKGITPVYGFKLNGTDKTIYYAGMFRKIADAGKALMGVKSKGFNDAFVVALSDNKTVSTDRAAILEKEWGNISFISTVETIPEPAVDTIPPTLTFRVEVMRSAKPLKNDVIEGMKTMAGTRGLDIQTLEDGKIVYLIGNFITFDSALEYADLLVRNGYRESKVVAWLGRREIPVDTARQLFNDME
jgi:tetratricopeptide (TPR) repeat protein